MSQVHPGFIADMLKHCERGEHPPLTVWEVQQLLTLAQRALASAPQASQPPQGAEPIIGHIQWSPGSETSPELRATLQEMVTKAGAALAAPPQGASSLLPGWKLSLDESASELLRDTIGAEDHSPITLSLGDGADGPGLYVWLTEYPEEGAILLAASPLPAPQDPAARIVAKPPKWEQHSDTEWSDDRGFYITFDDEEEEPYSAAWGEGDSERFKTLDEAKAWCVRELESWLNECGYAAPAPVDPESQGSSEPTDERKPESKR